jgi:hypothetical protein
VHVHALSLRPERSGVRAFGGLALGAVALIATLGALPSAASTSLALFPTGGSAPADQRTALDGSLRKAVSVEGDFSLLSAAETAENVEFMAEGGALCTPADVACLQKFGLVATVDLLLVTEARGRRTLDVTLRLIDVASGDVVRTIDGAVAARDAVAVAALVRRALHGQDDEPRATSEPAGARTDARPRMDEAGPAPATAPASGPAPGPAVDETEVTGRRLIGAWTAGVSGGVAVLALLGALGGEAVFWTGTGPATVRDTIVMPLAQTLWIVCAAGTAAAGVGGVLFVLDEPAASGTVPDDR